MKHLRLAISLCAFSALPLLGQDERQGAPQVEIPDFSNLDEYIYVPKSVMHFGTRYVSGLKSSFSGSGRIYTGENSGDLTSTDKSRAYHDGVVRIDTRITAVDNGDGTAGSIAVPADGKTNSWSYLDPRQATSDGLISFHTYSAEILPFASASKSLSGTVGLELYVVYEMGQLWKRIDWSIVAGVSMSDLNAKLSDRVRANITSINDTYNLFGEIAPTAPYTAPSPATTTTVTNADGTTSTDTADTTTLLGTTPLARVAGVTTDSTSVSNLWKLKGAYFTFRTGPSISVPIGSRFHASVSAGPAIVYAGSTYSVTQMFQPEIGAAVTATLSDGASKLLPGYYADATLNFDITERTGLYLGAVYQANGTYDQSISNGDAKYSTKIDLNGLNGLRAGMTYRF